MNIFPFYLNGEDFLYFYTFFGFISLILYHILRFLYESGRVNKLQLDDPYLIAYLRGGKNETLRILTISLVEKNILVYKNDELEVKKNSSNTEDLSTFERDVVNYFLYSKKANSIFTESSFEKHFEYYRHFLEINHLLPDNTIFYYRRISFLFLFGGIIILGALRIYFSIINSHYNLIYLLIIMGSLIFFFIKYSFPRLTIKGKKFLTNLQKIVKKELSSIPYSKKRVNLEHEHSLYMAALLGSSFITANYFYTNQLYPKAYKNLDSSSSTSSSCDTIQETVSKGMLTYDQVYLE